MKEGCALNKQELIDNIAESADISKAAAGRALDAMIDSISGCLLYTSDAADEE